MAHPFCTDIALTPRPVKSRHRGTGPRRCHPAVLRDGIVSPVAPRTRCHRACGRRQPASTILAVTSERRGRSPSRKASRAPCPSPSSRASARFQPRRRRRRRRPRRRRRTCHTAPSEFAEYEKPDYVGEGCPPASARSASPIFASSRARRLRLSMRSAGTLLGLGDARRPPATRAHGRRVGGRRGRAGRRAGRVAVRRTACARSGRPS